MPPTVSAIPVVKSAATPQQRGDQYALFGLAAVGMLLLAPQVVLVWQYEVLTLLGVPALPPVRSAWPYVPRMLPLGVLLALLTFRLDRQQRVAALVACMLPIAFARGALDVSSILPLSAFGLITYGLIRLRLRRLWTGIVVTAFATVSLMVASRWWEGAAFERVLATFPVLIPLLWYSVYEHGRQAMLGVRRFLLYLSTRLFSSPVLTYDDLFKGVTGEELTRTRWSGVRTIYIALLASIAAHLAALAAGAADREQLVGLPLLALSYVEYVGYYCRIVLRFNTVIGVLQLFGIPMRINFRYWLLARTPNEHWQRWNILAREWYLTFIFYPMMRVRRSILIAVMLVMLASGILHVAPLVILHGFSGPVVFASLVYAVVNALAIWVVIVLPRSFPALVQRLGMPGSRAWSIAGIVITSAFYSVLHGLRVWSGSWAEMAHYVSRLAGTFPV